MKIRTIQPIPGWPDYFAGSDGTIWSEKRSFRKQLRPQLQDGLTQTAPKYFFVVLRKSGKSYRRKVSRLVCQTFLGDPPPGKTCVLHGKKGSQVDSVDNLRWGSHQENMDDRERDGNQRKGEDSPTSKLTEKVVREIRRRHRDGETQISISLAL